MKILMKMRLFTKVSSILVAAVLLASPAFALAATVRTDANLALNENISGNLYIMNPTPVVAGQVDGDLTVAGGTVLVTGKVTQDGLITGGTLIVSGNFGGDVRMLGGNIYFEGQTQGEVFVAGGNVRIGPNAVINGDLIAYGGSVVVDPAAKITGTKRIQSGEDYADQQKNITVATKFLQTAFLIGQVISILSLLLVASILFWFAPAITNKVVTKALDKKSVWKNLGIGLMLFILLPVAAILCLVSTVGWIFGLALIFAFIMYLLASMVLSGVVFGGWLYLVTKKPKRFQMKWWALVAGVILLHIISLIPIFGWIIVAIFFLISWGAIARTQVEIFKGVK
jgi:cytoskeletal protein CcmA (bactofilin family)